MSLAEANRKYFDNISDAYDKKPWFATMNQSVTDYLRSRLEWIGIQTANTDSPHTKDFRLLDYACGPGLMSRIYGPYVTITRGIDISPNMVATYNARARAGELSPDKISGVVGNLFDKSNPNPEELSGAEYKDFDLATVGFGFHHFEDVIHASRCLKQRLRPGGMLVISDFLEGGDIKADEEGKPILGSEGDHAKHIHHGKHDDFKHNSDNSHAHHSHGEHHHEHHHGHHHGHTQHEDNGEAIAEVRAFKDTDDDATKKRVNEMNASIVVPHFTIDGVKKFFSEAGFVDVDVVTMPERVYMEFAGRKIWRTVLFARGRRPEEEKSEL